MLLHTWNSHRLLKALAGGSSVFSALPEVTLGEDVWFLSLSGWWFPRSSSPCKPKQNRKAREPKQGSLLWESTWLPGLCVACISWGIGASLTSPGPCALWETLPREWESVVSPSALSLPDGSLLCSTSWHALSLVVGTVTRDLQPLCHLVHIAVLQGQYHYCPRFRVVASEGWRGWTPSHDHIASE